MFASHLTPGDSSAGLGGVPDASDLDMERGKRKTTCVNIAERGALGEAVPQQRYKHLPLLNNLFFKEEEGHLSTVWCLGFARVQLSNKGHVTVRSVSGLKELRILACT